MEEWGRVDAFILERRIIQAVQAIRASRECGIPDALDILVDRYRHLRDARPEDFTVSDETYWDGFYS